MGNGNPTQMLNSDVAQQASGVLEGPGPVSHVSGEVERQAGWKALWLKLGLRSGVRLCLCCPRYLEPEAYSCRP